MSGKLDDQADATSVVDRVADLISTPEVRDDLGNDLAYQMERLLSETIRRKKPLLVDLVKRRLQGLQLAQVDPTAEQVGREWIDIHSLSRLRSIVGGRFQNLKMRWTKAGFPLREHRGDQSIEYELDDKGWLELASWIAKQGYEARLTPDRKESLFEVRKRE